MSAAGALLGLLVGFGLLLAFAGWRHQHAAEALERIAPQHPSGGTAGALALARLLVPSSIGRSQHAGIEMRLLHAGQERSVADYRASQLTWAGLGAIACGGLGIVLAGGTGSILGPVVLGVVGAVIGAILCDKHLTAQGRARQRAIDHQLPPVAELLALAVAAGQSPSAALETVGTCLTGELAQEISQVGARQRAGMSLEASLRHLAHRTGSPSVERCVDGIVVALERGTPMTSVLKAQATDSRAEQARALMELAGRKDSLMLVPVVFLILPVVVVIAMYPGVAGLELLVG